MHLSWICCRDYLYKGWNVKNWPCAWNPFWATEKTIAALVRVDEGSIDALVAF